jgi:hypothetical protein
MIGQKILSPSSFGAVVGCRIRDPGSGWIKIRIRDKHPGSATLPSLVPTVHYVTKTKWLNYNKGEIHPSVGLIVWTPIRQSLTKIKSRCEISLLAD